MTRLETVKTMWESFEAMVLPDDAPIDQVREMRRAFYAGCWAMLAGCSAIGNEDVTEEQGVAQLESWRKECERFVAMMNMGRT